MTDQLVYVDTETAGLRMDDRPWEVAAIVDLPNGDYEQHVWHIGDFRPSMSDPTALRMSGFYDRHPSWSLDEALAQLAVSGPDPDKPVQYRITYEAEVVAQFERLTRGKVVVGCNPGFDTFRVLERAFERHGYAPGWHYRPVCATTYAAARVDAIRAKGGEEPLPLPYNNEAIGQALGVPRNIGGEVHSGLSDAYYARALLRAARGVWEQS